MPATATPNARDTLRQIEAELAQQRDARAEARREKDEARDAFAAAAATSGSLSPDSPEFQAAQEAVARCGEIEDRIAQLQLLQVETLKMLGEEPPAPAAHPADSASPRIDGGWNSRTLLADEGVRQAVARMSASGQRPHGPVSLGEVAGPDRLVADITGTTNMRRADYAGVVPQLRRMLRVLDLIPTGTMDNNSLPYTQEQGSFDTAGETTEGDIKPEAALTFVDATADAQTIAHWLKVRKQALADFPALQAIIDGRLRYGVLRRLENQILAGDGSGSNLRGILNTTGLGAVTFGAGAPVVEQILRGITTVYLADSEATGVVMHPTDWQTALLTKATNAAGTVGSLEYVGGGPFTVTPQVMWGIPLVASRAIPQGTALVGDFEIGAQLLIREGVNVLLSDSDQDDFLRNRVTLLAEMRAALPVWRPPAFATVALQ